MVWIMCFIAFTLGAISMFTLVFIGYITKSEETVNKVKFYVARDKNGLLYLYVGKPERAYSCFLAPRGYCICRMEKECDFENFGLNENDYKDLKWEDEPVEVFVNMED